MPRCQLMTFTIIAALAAPSAAFACFYVWIARDGDQLPLPEVALE
jgi:hypothetical protein